MMAVNLVRNWSAAWRGLCGSVAIALFLLLAAVQDAAATLLDVKVGGETIVLDLVTDLPPGLPLTSYRTNTVWTEDADLYTGVLLRDLLHHLGVDSMRADSMRAGTSVTFHALDGYSATLNYQMLHDDRPLLAFLRNDAPMARREHGPYWLIFDYDSDARFRTETYYALSVWQIERIVIAD